MFINLFNQWAGFTNMTHKALIAPTPLTVVTPALSQFIAPRRVTRNSRRWSGQKALASIPLVEAGDKDMSSMLPLMPAASLRQGQRSTCQYVAAKLGCPGVHPLAMSEDLTFNGLMGVTAITQRALHQSCSEHRRVDVQGSALLKR